YNKQYLPSEALVDIVISKSPKEIKTLLWQAKLNGKNWIEVVKMAEELACLAYNDEMKVQKNSDLEKFNQKKSDEEIIEINKIEKSNYDIGKNKNYNIKKCILHGKCRHSTEECFSIKKLEKNGWSKILKTYDEQEENP
ncbi:hypothetical protein H311_05113, partial [Anncaliia algerae PRA109]